MERYTLKQTDSAMERERGGGEREREREREQIGLLIIYKNELPGTFI